MKVFIVMRNDKIDHVFFNVDPAIARAAAEARSRELTAKWAITRVVEQAVIVPEPGPVLADVSVVTATAYRWRYRGAIKWQYGELTEENARLAEEHNHEVQPLYAKPISERSR